jgi:hypothetical protein
MVFLGGGIVDIFLLAIIGICVAATLLVIGGFAVISYAISLSEKEERRDFDGDQKCEAG